MALAYGTPTAIAVTSMNSLASSTTNGISSASVTTPTTDNTADCFVQVHASLGTFTASATTGIYVWAYGSVDGTDWPTGFSGTDQAITGLTPTTGNQLRFLGYIPGVSATVVKSQPFSIAAAFGGVLPPRWALAIQNQTGVALAASGHVAEYVSAGY